MSIRKEPIYYENLSKYLKAPEWWQIEEFINELGVNMFQFERFYGIPFNTLIQVKAGKRGLAPNYWHFIYERIKPAYGIGFVVDYSTKQTKNRIKHHITTKITTTDSHNRLDEIK